MNEVKASLYSKKKSKLNIVLNVLIAVIAFALLFEVVFATTYSGIYVVGTSMNDTLTGAESEDTAGGDYVFVNRHAKPDYGDIVVVFTEKNKTIIKRVIAMGGDRVKLVRGQLYIKYSGKDEFVEVEEAYVSAANNSSVSDQNSFPWVNNEIDENGYLVEKDCLFLLGDNRNVSLDSRGKINVHNGLKSSIPENFPVKNLYGVVAGWSLNNKNFFSVIHRYFYFDWPKSLGLK